MGIWSSLKGLFSGTKTIDIDTTQMKLVSREEFEAPNGTGIRETYVEGYRVITVTATSAEVKESAH